MTADHAIGTRPCPDCYVCGTGGSPLYPHLEDRLFGVPGEWDLLRCNNQACGLIWLDPMPAEEDLPKAYQTYYTHQDRRRRGSLLRALYGAIKNAYLAEKYAYRDGRVPLWRRALAQLAGLLPVRRAYFDFSVFYLPALPNGRLLEVGCGSGEMLKSMESHGWRVEGVDFDPVAVGNARDKGLDVRLGGLAEQRYADDVFDAIAMSHVIEHVPDPAGLLAECWRILKPGGQLVVVTPNTDSLGHRLFKSDWRGLEPPRHLHLFNSRSLRQIAARAGFSDFSTFTSPRDAGNLFLASLNIRRSRLGGAACRIPLLSWLGCFALQGIEALSLKSRPEIGEELVLIGKKWFR